MADSLPVHEYGNPRAPLVVLLHPGGALHSVWRPFIRALGDRYRILAPDFVPSGRLSLQDLAAQTTRLIETTSEKPVYLVGTSMGANVAILVAAQAPQRVAGLVLDSAQTGGKPPAFLPPAVSFFKNIARILPQRWITALLLSQYRGYPPADRQAIRAEMEHGSKTAFFEQIEAHFDYDASSMLSHITAPTLILAGENDPLTKAGEPLKLQQGIQSAVLKVIPAAGHVTFLHQPARFEQEVIPFLAELG